MSLRGLPELTLVSARECNDEAISKGVPIRIHNLIKTNYEYVYNIQIRDCRAPIGRSQ